MSAKPTSDALSPIEPGPQSQVAESRIYRTPSSSSSSQPYQRTWYYIFLFNVRDARTLLTSHSDSPSTS